MIRAGTLVLAAVAIAAASAIFNFNSYVTSLLVFAAVHALLCLGFYVIFGLTGILSLAHAAFMAIGAYASGILTTRYGLPFPAAVVCAMLTAGVTGAVLGIPTLRLKSHYLVLVTIAFSEVMRQSIINMESVTGGVQGLNLAWSSRLWGIDFANPHVYLLMCLLVLAGCILLLLRLRDTRVGRSLEAIRDDELAAGVIGVDVVFFKIFAFVLSASIAGLAGALYAHFVGFLSPEHFTFDITILVLAMAVTGGKRSIAGAVIGAAILTFLPEVLRGLKDWYPIVYGLLLLLVLWFAPTGLIGKLQDLRLARRDRIGSAVALRKGLSK